MKKILIAVLTVSILFTACSKDEGDLLIDASEFTVTIAENPSQGQSLGTIPVTAENYSSIRFFFKSENTGLAEHVDLNSTTGELTISNPSYFDYEQRDKATGDAGVEVRSSDDDAASDDFLITINITDVVETPPPPVNSVQERLDAGETPSQIYNSNSGLLDSLYGKTYAGGLIAYLNTATGNGFVVASTDQSVALIWDPNQPAGSGTAGTNDAIGNGPLNTNAIVNTIGAGSYAAQICNDLVLNTFSDWFLPSRDELTEVYNNLHLNGLGNFQNMSYWSSSETATTSIVWYRKFDTGQEGMGGSEQLFGVRAARTF